MSVIITKAFMTIYNSHLSCLKTIYNSPQPICILHKSFKHNKKKFLIEGLAQRVSFCIQTRSYQGLVFNGTLRVDGNSYNICSLLFVETKQNSIPAQMYSTNKSNFIPKRIHNPDRRLVLRSRPISVIDNEFSDWEMIETDPTKIELRIKECLDTAANIGSLLEEEEDWVYLTNSDINRTFKSYLKDLRREAQYEHNTSIIDHINPIISSSSIEESATVAFAEGKIVPFINNQTATSSLKVLTLLLTETYGVILTRSILSRYQLTKKQTISLEDIKKTLLGISVNVKITDLKELFDDIKSKNGAYHCLKVLSLEEVDALLQAPEFESLKPIQIANLLKCFQTLGTSPDHMLEILFQGYSKGLAIWQFDCFNHDTEVAKRLSFIDTVNREHLRLSLSEHLCKNIAYLELKIGMIVPMLTETGDRIFYTIFNKLEDKKDGIICSLLAPLNHAQTKYSKEDPLVIYLNFRGTQWQPDRKDSYESLQRDLDYAGIGKQSFQVRVNEILEMVTKYLETSAVPWIKLCICGHSLGGTDVQRSLQAFTKLLAQPSPGKGLEKIVGIDAFFHNSPAPDASLNEQFAKDLKALEKINRNIPLNLMLILFATDPLQNAGDMYLGAQIKSPLLTKKVCFAKSKEWKYFAAHRLKAFVYPQDPCEISFIDANTPNDLLEKIFSRSFYWNLENDTWISSSGKRLYWYSGCALMPIKKIVDTSVYYSFGLIRGIIRSLSQQRTEEAHSSGWGTTKKITVHPSNY